MLFFSFFKTLVDQEIILELKNDIEIKGTLRSVDQYLNLKMDNVSTVNETKYPHLKAVKTLFIRGSTVRYVHMSASAVDCTLLQDASRRGMCYFEKCYDMLLTNRGHGSSRQINLVLAIKPMHVYITFCIIQYTKSGIRYAPLSSFLYAMLWVNALLLALRFRWLSIQSGKAPGSCVAWLVAV